METTLETDRQERSKTTLGSGWVVKRGKGWRKWINCELGAWVTHWKHSPNQVQCGMSGQYIGVLTFSPQEAMDYFSGNDTQNRD